METRRKMFLNGLIATVVRGYESMELFKPVGTFGIVTIIVMPKINLVCVILSLDGRI